MALRKAFLICSAGSHAPIELRHLEKVFVGRTPETGIIDKRVSRKQAELIANCDEHFVEVQSIGSNPCQINNELLLKEAKGILKPGDFLYLLEEKYKHAVEFEEATSKEMKKARAAVGRPIDDRKRKSHDDESIVPVEKKKKNESNDEDSKDSIDDVKDRLKLMRDALKGFSKNENKVGTSGGDSIKSEAGCSQEAPASVWKKEGSMLIFTSKGVKSSTKVAGFDIDGTIITTQSGKVFPTNAADWKILLPEVPGRLKKLHAEGYKVVFFTNQMGIQTGKVKEGDFKKKLENIVAKLGTPIQAFVATAVGMYRKPGTGMWEHLKKYENCDMPVIETESLYVGDAAGRPKDWKAGKKKDHSCADRLFAINVGLKFFTPEEFFLNEKTAKFDMPIFDPMNLKLGGPLLDPSSAQLVLGKQELIVMVGLPASGKSYFVQKHLLPAGYVHVNRDTLNTWQKCVQKAKDAISKKMSVVIDNTSPDKESRKRYIEVAQAAGIPCRCFMMPHSFDQARHNERFREMTDTSHQKISDMVFNSYKSKYEEPSLAEGFTEVVRVNFLPDFKNKQHEKLYKQYILDK